MQITITAEFRLTIDEWKAGADKVLRDQPSEWTLDLNADPDTITAFLITLNTAMREHLRMAPTDLAGDTGT